MTPDAPASASDGPPVAYRLLAMVALFRAPESGNIIYLIPVFGMVLAVTLLGVNFKIFLELDIGTIAVGIWLAMFTQKKNIPL